jgi:DNA-directed RNA polymerase alpha subunit
MRDSARTADVLRLRYDGATYSEIATSFGISACRVRQIIQKALLTLCYRKSIKYEKSYLKVGSSMLVEAIYINDGFGLSERSRNNLKRGGLLSVKQAREALRNSELKDIDGMGETSIQEIEKWLQGSPLDRHITQSESTVYLESAREK